MPHESSVFSFCHVKHSFPATVPDCECLRDHETHGTFNYFQVYVRVRNTGTCFGNIDVHSYSTSNDSVFGSM